MLHLVNYKYLKSFLGISKIPYSAISSNPNSFLTKPDILVNKTAAVSSNLGTDVYFIDAARDFAITKLR